MFIKGKRATLYGKQGIPVANSQLMLNPNSFACEQDSQTTEMPIIHPDILRDSFLRKRTENYTDRRKILL